MKPGKLRDIVHRVIALDSVLGRCIVNAFHFIWYHSLETWPKNTFLGYPIYQCPFDLQLYQEIIYKIKPSCIVQTGVAEGGSLLFFASLMDLIGADHSQLVIGVDIKLSDSAKQLKHPRIRLVEGDSVSPSVVKQVHALISDKKGLVSLDSLHSKEHVLEEMRIYSRFVEVGSYLVAEDANVNFHPVLPDHGPGPREAVDVFMRGNTSYIQDNELWKRNGFSFHQYGWLRRIS